MEIEGFIFDLNFVEVYEENVTTFVVFIAVQFGDFQVYFKT